MAARHRDEIDVLGLEPAEIEQPLDRPAWKCAVVLCSAEPLLICGSQDYAIVEQDSPGIMGMRNSQEKLDRFLSVDFSVQVSFRTHNKS